MEWLCECWHFTVSKRLAEKAMIQGGHKTNTINKEYTGMLEVTESALGNVKEYLRQQKLETAVRITMMSGGCSGPSLGLSIDDAKENDKVFDYEGVSFLVDKELSTICGAIKVDFIVDNSAGCGCSGGGFSVTSENPISSGGCGCSCSSGSCG